MNIRQWFSIACGAALLAGASGAIGQAARDAVSIDADGLVRVKSRQLDQVYLKPGVDFRRYTKVVFDPVDVTFAENWMFEMNRNKIAVLQGTTNADAERIAGETKVSLRKSFSAAFRNAGYQTVAAAGFGRSRSFAAPVRPVHHCAGERHAGAARQPRLHA